MSSPAARPRILIFVVAYNAERTISEVLRRVPAELARYDTHVLIIDDASADRTFERGRGAAGDLPFPVTVLFNPVNQGYGGNQKIGFHYAISEGFDVVALLHGDGQYAPERLPELLRPLLDGEADAVFGSRMLTPLGALQGGMPLYKYVGNRLLTGLQNRLLHASLSEFHSGYRLYSVPALARVPFQLNTNDFHFDTEIIIQLLLAGLRIRELPIPTYYGDEICHVDGLRYARDVVQATVLARLQRLHVLYQRRFDVGPPPQSEDFERPRLAFDSLQRTVLSHVPPAARVLLVGPAAAVLEEPLIRRGCEVRSVEPDALPDTLADFGHVVLLDVVNHVPSPEGYAARLQAAAGEAVDTRLYVSAGNVGFVVPRLMHLAGQLNYNARGILDFAHSRLFTLPALRRLLEHAGFVVEESHGVPAPFPLALGPGRAARALLSVNRKLIGLSPGWFAYQVLCVVRPSPSLPWLLHTARKVSAARSVRFDEPADDR